MIYAYIAIIGIAWFHVAERIRPCLLTCLVQLAHLPGYIVALGVA